MTDKCQTESVEDRINAMCCHEVPELPIEVVIQIMTYLSVADRMSAGLANKMWRAASLSSIFIDSQILTLGCNDRSRNLQKMLEVLDSSNRQFYHFVFENVELKRSFTIWDKYGSSMKTLILRCCDLSEKTLVEILKCCKNLKLLHISDCRECFMSGRLLQDEEDVKELSESLKNLKELNLASNRYLSDALFNRLVATCQNLESLSLMNCHILFHPGIYKKFYPKGPSFSHASESVLTFLNVLHFVTQKAPSLKCLSFGQTLIDGTALTTLCSLKRLQLEMLWLKACDQLTNSGIRSLTEYQTKLTQLDLSLCSRVTDASLLTICNKLQNLEVFSIRRCRAVTDLGVSQIRLLRRLKHLDISECEQLTGACFTEGLCREMTDPEVKEDTEDSLDTESTRRDENLQWLSANALNLDEKSIESISSCFPNLRYLNLGYCFNAVTDRTIQFLLKELSSLQFLLLSRCDKVSDIGLTGMSVEGVDENVVREHLVPVASAKPFLRISLGSRAEDEILRDAKRKQEIKRFFEDSTDRDEKISWGYSLLRLKRLREIDLSGCNRITDASLTYAFNFPELRYLDLSMCQQITSVGLDFLTKKNTAIEELKLSQCHNITDSGILCVARRLHRLKRLHLQKCSQLTDESLESLRYCRSLQYLDVRCCRSVTRTGVEKLTHAFVEISETQEDTSLGEKFPPPAPPPLYR